MQVAGHSLVVVVDVVGDDVAEELRPLRHLHLFLVHLSVVDGHASDLGEYPHGVDRLLFQDLVRLGLLDLYEAFDAPVPLCEQYLEVIEFVPFGLVLPGQSDSLDIEVQGLFGLDELLGSRPHEVDVLGHPVPVVHVLAHSLLAIGDPLDLLSALALVPVRGTHAEQLLVLVQDADYEGLDGEEVGYGRGDLLKHRVEALHRHDVAEDAEHLARESDRAGTLLRLALGLLPALLFLHRASLDIDSMLRFRNTPAY